MRWGVYSKMVVQQTSLDVYLTLKRSNITLSLRIRVLDYLRNNVGGFTGYEISKATHLSILNVRPRLTELKSLGLIRIVGRKDNQMLWRISS